MAKRSFSVGEGQTFSIQVDDIDWFEKTLHEKCIAIPPRMGIVLEDVRSLALTIAVATHAARMVPKGVLVGVTPSARVDVAHVLALISLIRALRAALSQNQQLLDGAWHLLAGDIPLAVPRAQNPQRDHVWEFLNAAILADFATGMQVNHSQAGVDVKAAFRAMQWGVECKVIYTDDIDNRIDRIIDGVKQLETDPTVLNGVIAVNVTNCVDHTIFHRSLSVDPSMFASEKNAVVELASAVRTIALNTATPSFRKRFIADKNGKPRRKCRAVIYLAQTVAFVGGRHRICTAQFSALRTPAVARDRVFVNRYHLGCKHLL